MTIKAENESGVQVDFRELGGLQTGQQVPSAAVKSDCAGQCFWFVLRRRGTWADIRCAGRMAEGGICQRDVRVSRVAEKWGIRAPIRQNERGETAYLVLDAIDVLGNPTRSQIAAHADLTPGQVAHAVRRLSSSKWGAWIVGERVEQPIGIAEAYGLTMRGAMRLAEERQRREV